MNEMKAFGKIRITVGGVVVVAEIFDTPCGRAVCEALPLESVPGEWGDEFYFDIPVTQELDETARTVLKAGDIGYWPPGRALAIFFGPTPASSGEDPVAASEVNLVGKVADDSSVLRRALGAKVILVEKIAS